MCLFLIHTCSSDYFHFIPPHAPTPTQLKGKKMEEVKHGGELEDFEDCQETERSGWSEESLWSTRISCRVWRKSLKEIWKLQKILVKFSVYQFSSSNYNENIRVENSIGYSLFSVLACDLWYLQKKQLPRALYRQSHLSRQIFEGFSEWGLFRNRLSAIVVLNRTQSRVAPIRLCSRLIGDSG